EPPPRLKDPWCVHQQDLRVVLNGDAHQPRTRGLRLVADDRDFLSNQRVDERGLAGVGRADDGDEAGARFVFAHLSCASSASAAAVSASCLLDPSAVASPSFGTDTLMVKRGA